MDPLACVVLPMKEEIYSSECSNHLVVIACGLHGHVSTKYLMHAHLCGGGRPESLLSIARSCVNDDTPSRRIVGVDVRDMLGALLREGDEYKRYLVSISYREYPSMDVHLFVAVVATRDSDGAGGVASNKLEKMYQGDTTWVKMCDKACVLVSDICATTTHACDGCV